MASENRTNHRDSRPSTLVRGVGGLCTSLMFYFIASLRLSRVTVFVAPDFSLFRCNSRCSTRETIPLRHFPTPVSEPEQTATLDHWISHRVKKYLSTVAIVIVRLRSYHCLDPNLGWAPSRKALLAKRHLTARLDCLDWDNISYRELGKEPG